VWVARCRRRGVPQPERPAAHLPAEQRRLLSSRIRIGKRHHQNFVVGVRLQPPRVPVAGSPYEDTVELVPPPARTPLAQARLAWLSWRLRRWFA
jgi:hypothetical protein